MVRRDSRWHRDWQSEGHVRLFDSRSALSDRALIAHYEAFNDVHLLGEFLSRNPQLYLVEVGCATGEFYRYLRLKYPSVQYAGVDIARPALERARRKYPEALFVLQEPGFSLSGWLRSVGRPEKVAVIYSKDVVHHQPDPFDFLGQLLEAASGAAILRLRTRDSGASVLDPNLSCQHHYNGWMPYLVMNLQETVEYVQRSLPHCEVIVQRHHVILGGRENRYLPKECYLPETGTAETAMAVLLNSDHPGEVRIEDKPEMRFPAPWYARWRNRIRAGGQAREG